METAEQAVQTAVPRQRRVGTFTLGIVLVIAGAGMLASMFWPQFQPEWLLKASPCILILLGIETLLSARGGGRVKYDWLGMFLCFILTGAALCMYCAAWWVVNGNSLVSASRWANEYLYEMTYDRLDGADSHTMRLEAGDTLQCQIYTYYGRLEVEISDEDGNTLCEGNALEGNHTIEIPRTGDYTILVWGRHAGGGFSFVRAVAGEVPPAEEAPPETERYSEIETVPQEDG
ncbi:hypothetical protein [uncultured Oscillibacter sp.]|uniref:hypothetical protein n=1 Tax=uncultured Oscillibacter sp. TaxID=876091 RepID=UPI0025D3F871|nr:hypothetical protein [uncultured Oscillibacter sp.]